MGNDKQSLQTVPAFSLEPKTLDEAIKYADLISKSDLVPDCYKGKAGNVLIAVQMGAEVGLKPLQALQSIAVINGQPCIYGDGALALVLDSKHCEYVKEDSMEKIQREGKATCVAKRKGSPAEAVRTFSLEDAKRAGLLNKAGTWQQYPARMLQMRARGFALRDAFSDVLKGLAIREEVEDYEVLTHTAEDKFPMPQRVQEATVVQETPSLTVDAPKAENGAQPEAKATTAIEEAPVSQPVIENWMIGVSTKINFCIVCKAKIPVGTKVFYDPKVKGVRCQNCDPEPGKRVAP